jgi:hypothetical protein
MSLNDLLESCTAVQLRFGLDLHSFRARIVWVALPGLMLLAAHAQTRDQTTKPEDVNEAYLREYYTNPSTRFQCVTA